MISDASSRAIKCKNEDQNIKGKIINIYIQTGYKKTSQS